MHYRASAVISTFDEARQWLDTQVAQGKSHLKPVGLREIHYGNRKVWNFLTPYEELSLIDAGQIVHSSEPIWYWENTEYGKE